MAGAGRVRGHALAASSTPNRLGLGTPEKAATHRYKKSSWNMDATDDPLHGKQEGRFFHGVMGITVIFRVEPASPDLRDFRAGKRTRPRHSCHPRASI